MKLNFVKALALMFFGALAFVACDPDECKDVACDHGDCFEGACVCGQGWEEDANGSCTVTWAKKFVGDWNGADNCGYTFASEITEVDSTTLKVKNFAGWDVAQFVNVTVNAASTITFTNATDASGRKFTGTGTYYDGSAVDSLKLNYTVTFSDNTTQTCDVKYTK